VSLPRSRSYNTHCVSQTWANMSHNLMILLLCLLLKLLQAGHGFDNLTLTFDLWPLTPKDKWQIIGLKSQSRSSGAKFGDNLICWWVDCLFLNLDLGLKHFYSLGFLPPAPLKLRPNGAIEIRLLLLLLLWLWLLLLWTISQHVQSTCDRFHLKYAKVFF